MPVLNFEHVAYNVSDPVAIAAWYVEHLGLRVVRQGGAPSHMHFLADAASHTVIELYNNPADPVPDYASMHPMRLHLAFNAPDPDAAKSALLTAGATPVDDQTLPDGSRLIMLRDPWGMALQLCKRAQPLLP